MPSGLTPGAAEPRIGRLSVVAGLYLALHLWPVWRPESSMWGVDSLAYLPGWASVLFVAVAVASYLAAVRRRAPWERLGRAGAMAGAVAAIAIFVALPSASPLLGDGQLILRSFRDAASLGSSQGVNAPLPMWVIGAIRAIGVPAATAVPVLSVISGIAGVLAAVVLSTRIDGLRHRRALLTALVFTQGYVMLFCGYVETYALAAAVLLTYLLLGLRSLSPHRPLWPPAVALGLLISTHFTLVALTPSLLVLAAARHRAGTGIVRTGAELAVFPLTALTILALIGFDASTYLSSARATHLLPLIDGASFEFPYGALSLAHGLDVINQYLLAAPAAVILLVAAPRAWIEPRPERAFLLLAVGAPVLVTVAAHPEIGAFRDWDAFSLAAVPLTVMAALILPGSDRGASPAAAVVIVVVSLLHTLPWIAVHADAELAERRFVACLQNLELSPAARAYGWETLGVHRREQGDDRAAHEAFAAALEANPGNHRYWNDLGTTAARLGDETAAIDSYARALELHPEATAIRLNLADAYRRAGRDQEGRSAYEQVLARDPRSGRAAYYAGTLSLRLGDRTRARQHFRHVLAIDPSFEKAEALRRWLQEDAVP